MNRSVSLLSSSSIASVAAVEPVTAAPLGSGKYFFIEIRRERFFKERYDGRVAGSSRVGVCGVPACACACVCACCVCRWAGRCEPPVPRPCPLSVLGGGVCLHTPHMRARPRMCARAPQRHSHIRALSFYTHTHTHPTQLAILKLDAQTHTAVCRKSRQLRRPAYASPALPRLISISISG